ncbi:BMP family ABC transporter substrate-binding protein [Kocuria dechangensis]|uniref:BMP family ABC transporter substrate-binding protein n=1 Tax=Kocuria dechangensis TaxID=1176249 RepID=A0A917LLW8_9MICC|nr:BMP family ABC transporter substrate-binding protein [Kocuria dechangensis]GGG42635.1 BMP family ABC transporter substrate-binding protein [Kocuria dechangensis]
MTFAPRTSRGSRALSAAALLGASTLVLAGCGAAPEEGGEATAEATDFAGCIVSDSGGFQDRSFNQNSYEGLQAAAESTGIEVKQAESQAETDFEPNLNSMVQSGCDLTISVGFLLADATKTVAEANPEARFAIVDDSSIELDNVKPLVYNTAEAAFLAGYVAAGATETGKVATYGGMDIPTVTVFMDGFADGIDHYNQVKGANVELLGWNKDSQDGTFVNSFTDTSAAKTTTQNFINEGADIVMPVAGQAALGTLDAVVAANDGGNEVRFVWVDADGYETLDQGKEYQLTSVLKQMSTSVQDVVETAAAGEFDSTPYVGTLENDGVGIAPFHDQEEAVGEELAGEVEQLRQEIIDGTVVVESENSPQA